MIQLKIVIVSVLWTFGWVLHFASTDAAVNAMNLSIAFAPGIALFFVVLTVCLGRLMHLLALEQKFDLDLCEQVCREVYDR